MLGASADVMSVLQILNDTVRGVGGSEYAMSCFAAVFDFDSGTVTYANAGHPFPYICRRPAEGQRIDRAQLSALVSRGTPLGSDEVILSAATTELEPDDVVVFYSDSVVDLLSPDGVPYGDRRLQRVLRTRVRSAGDTACKVILDDAMGHFGDREVVDDINLIVVKLGESRA
jgi:serine phosphatase RsbU (regulator of sigma subunit)